MPKEIADIAHIRQKVESASKKLAAYWEALDELEDALAFDIGDLYEKFDALIGDANERTPTREEINDVAVQLWQEALHAKTRHDAVCAEIDKLTERTR